MKDFFSQIQTRRVFWVYIVASLIAVLAVSVGSLFGTFGDKFEFAFLLLNVLILVWFWMKMQKVKYQEEKSLKKYIQWKEVLFLLFFNILFSAGVIFFLSYLIFHFFPGVVGWLMEQPPIVLSKEWNVILISFLVTVLCGPIVEEFIFRGVMFNRFTKRWGLKTGIFASSFFFGLVHGDPFMAVGAFVFGVTLCVLYVKSHIIVPIIIHILNNLFVFLIELAVLFFDTESSNVSTEQMIEESEKYGLSVGLPLLLISGFFLFRYIKKNWPQIEKTV